MQKLFPGYFEAWGKSKTETWSMICQKARVGVTEKQEDQLHANFHGSSFWWMLAATEHNQPAK